MVGSYGAVDLPRPKLKKLSKSKWTSIFAGFVVLTACIVVMNVSTSLKTQKVTFSTATDFLASPDLQSQNVQSPSHTLHVTERQLSPSGLAFLTETKYTKRGDAPVYSDYVWAAGPIVEPYLPTTLVVQDPVPSMTYKWTWQGNIYHSRSIEVVHPEVGTLPLVLVEEDQEGKTIRELHTNLVFKYVRREIRNLLDEDREAFFDAMEYMVKTPQTVGMAVYGPKYRSMNYFVTMHNVLSNDPACDRMHKGMGFLHQHMGMTLEFEQALQVVNPALTVPYWDYTIDAHEVGQIDGVKYDDYMNSVIFSDDWFGTYDKETHTLDQGRWAGLLKVETDMWDSPVHNSYGMNRSPWNNNNSPLMQRFSTLSGAPFEDYQTWPTCSSHLDAVKMPYTMKDFYYEITQAPHVGAHGVLGGTTGADEIYDYLEQFFDPEVVVQLRAKAVTSAKDLWRFGLHNSCPEKCEMDTPPEDCVCTCGSPEELSAKLADEGLVNAAWDLATNKEITREYTLEDKKLFLTQICKGGLITGDQMEDASPLDPLFWPIHSTLERFTHWRMLHMGFLDETWPEKSEDAYWGGVPYGNDQYCYMHMRDDILPWNLKMDGEADAHQYTNWEMYKMLVWVAEELSAKLADEDFVNAAWDIASEGGHAASKGGTITREYTLEDKKLFLTQICKGGLITGDQMNDSSPLDLIFWPMHTTLQRLAHWRKLHIGLLDEAWPERSEDAYWGQPTYGNEQYCYQHCNGHMRDDILPWNLKMD
eukprot:CAMPEP_0113952758 /NCGR_PEP_ID=MMETSP1339-20121228/90594_1 /TAXON_ID=94617 /ORGANISM="Fibrocapsa japonica" /LENGTH=755 /DNA_ID=CAMNT_0000961419 /DNA_START=61 /DNA_END=2326 /DNA_ORIENTATION=+ /assembly_acc=CAM_ASM_000762